MKISAVINTISGEEKYIVDCLKSLKWVDEIVIVDMHSSDNTVKLAKKYTSKIFEHKFVNFVEPARNFAISKTTGDWVLILDPDERVPAKLAQVLRKIATENEFDYVQIPRKNIIFGKWMEKTRWWPDYNIRFFRKGSVTWKNEIHSVPQTTGEGLTLDAKPEMALEHLHYSSIETFLNRMHRYTTIQSENLLRTKHVFVWTDLVTKPVNEFLSRFFAAEGYKDGVHGLGLSLLQAFSELVVYLKVWEAQGFKQTKGEKFHQEFAQVAETQGKAFVYWLTTLKLNTTQNPVQKVRLRIRRKLGV